MTPDGNNSDHGPPAVDDAAGVLPYRQRILYAVVIPNAVFQAVLFWFWVRPRLRSHHIPGGPGDFRALFGLVAWLVFEVVLVLPALLWTIRKAAEPMRGPTEALASGAVRTLMPAVICIAVFFVAHLIAMLS